MYAWSSTCCWIADELVGVWAGTDMFGCELTATFNSMNSIEYDYQNCIMQNEALGVKSYRVQELETASCMGKDVQVRSGACPYAA